MIEVPPSYEMGKRGIWAETVLITGHLGPAGFREVAAGNGSKKKHPRNVSRVLP
jgi:hypothetical protein